MTKNHISTIAIFAVAASMFAAPAHAAQASAQVADVPGNELGTVTISDTASGMTLVKINLSGLQPGAHAIHLHETGDCSAGDFSSAGGHFTGGKEHGVQTQGGPHSGDMPNVTVGSDGTLVLDMFLPDVTVDDIMDDDGAAFIMHSGEDDYESQPSGDAGDRVTCGVFQ